MELGGLGRKHGAEIVKSSRPAWAVQKNPVSKTQISARDEPHMKSWAQSPEKRGIVVETCHSSSQE